ncbi:MAG: hypothetical protein M3R36_07780 [Bacteroidota bacterium]|nr:hypothetical protein [Bacteroidota bacterium]
MCVGGSFVVDELDIINEEFTCEGQVNTNGKNVVLGDSTIINFKPQGKITVNGGSFGGVPSYPIKFRGENGQSWGGIFLNNGNDNVFVNFVFENTSGYAITGMNSSVNLESCIFNINSGAILLTNIVTTTNRNAYIKNCKFNISNSPRATCNLSANASAMLNVQMDGNDFTHANGNVAIYTNSAFGSIKNNKINQYSYGIYSSSSSIDIYNNTINSSLSNSKGIYAVAMSNINLGINSSGVLTGGSNTLKNSGYNSVNIFVDNSYFNIHRGYNNFSITNVLPSTSYHLKGTFPESQIRDYPSIYSRNNCFKLAENIDVAKHYVFWTNSKQHTSKFSFNTLQLFKTSHSRRRSCYS